MYKSISLFTGGGGLDCGLEAVGFDARFCTDIDWHSCVTLRHARLRANLGLKGGLRNAAIVQSDINDLQPDFILEKAGLRIGETDLLTGGPPCQSFSIFGRRKGLADPRGQLVWQYLRILRGIRPKVFLFENVPGLLTIENGEVLKRFLDAVQQPFDGHTYQVKKYVLEAARYGVPQFRTRIIIMGVLDGAGRPALPDNPPAETHAENHKSLPLFRESGVLPFNTVADALRGLPAMGADGSPRCHTGRDHSDVIIERYRNLRHGERDSKTRINKLHPSRPSYTIIVGSDKGGGKGHVHPFEAREVTARESARMQTFPDWWGFSGRTRHPIRQIGNAVPPVLAAKIGEFIIEEIFGGLVPTRKIICERLGQGHLLEAEQEKVTAHSNEQDSLTTPDTHSERQGSRPRRASREQSVGQL